jgi:hypothetical protein
MQRDSETALYFIKALALLVLGLGLYAGWKVLPYYMTSLEFKESMASLARIYGGSAEWSEALREAIYRDAQDKHLPIERADIQVESTPSGARVAVDYTLIADLGFCRLPLHFHPQYPEPKQFFPPFERGILAAVGLVLGLYWFFRGFGLFLEYKVIADTPLVPIRSVAMGRVQIHGRAAGEKTLRSPVSNLPCFLYKVAIERWAEGRQGLGRWNPYLADQGSVGFYLEDETGRILIDPRAAELDLEEAYQCELSSREVLPLVAPWRPETSAARPAGFPAPDSELRRYVARVAAGMDTAAFQGADLASSLEAGKQRRKPRRSLAGSFGALLTIFPLASLGQVGSGAAPGDYRLTEYCVVPESEYDITGTCAINPDATNDLDRQIITKGENDKTFLISNQTEKGLEQDLHVRAWWHIVGGGLLAVAGAAALLEALGFLV